MHNYSGTRNCLSGIIFEETAPVSAKVQLEDGIILRRHHNQLLARPTQPIEHQVSQPIPSELGSEDSSQVIPPVIVVPEPKTTAGKSEGTVPVETPERRYPTSVKIRHQVSNKNSFQEKNCALFDRN